MNDQVPPTVLPLRFLPGTAKLAVRLGAGSRSAVIPPNGVRTPDAFLLEFIWHTPEGLTSAPMALQLVAETSPMELAAWLTRIAAGLFAGVMDIPVEEQPKPPSLRVVTNEESGEA